MGKQYSEISEKHRGFIEQQKIFFVASATADSRINVSPKGMDSFKVVDKNRVVWLNATGSGNETSAHVQQQPRMTIMFMAVEGNPLILRLYGRAKVIHKKDPQWDELLSLFPSIPATRQFFDVTIEMVQTSCGMAVPFYDYVEGREQLNVHNAKQGDAKINEYWQAKNQVSIDAIPSHIVSKNIG
ncbi:MAG: pyridoxamine 5'-phosphate oxidase [SAR86 cluster bacterium]|uniref:Pyridoxamine 5'-phosphate oxidase n=1 Tax=SAR86 cluster bacterium TaxID=2030880 RepID=A0A2A4MRW1_9GAMM|nr:MAG: pyridoxamine 5'-phosphate oxidase [SAR86 cluster bacterium]